MEAADQSQSTGGPFFPGFNYDPARRPFTYDVFLSSSSEVATLRDVVEDFVIRSFKPALEAYANAALNVVRWEQALTSQRPGESINDVFVRTAVKCHHTLVLLMTHLGPGTREEVEAAIEAGRPVSVVRFIPPEGHQSEFDPGEIDTFFDTFKEQGKPVFYASAGRPDSTQTWQVLAHTLGGIMLGVYRRYLAEQTDPIKELRGDR